MSGKSLRDGGRMLYPERPAYLKTLQGALAGVGSAQVVLARARQRWATDPL